MHQSAAEIVREYGPFPGIDQRAWRIYDGRHVWFATGDKLNALDPSSGAIVRSIDVAAHAGNGVRRPHLFQIAEDRIQKIDPKTGRCWPRSRRPARRRLGSRVGRRDRSGSASIATGRSTRSIRRPDRYCARSSPSASSPGVTWIDGELWHGTWEGDESDVRRIDPEQERSWKRAPNAAGIGVSGLESNGGDLFFCGGGPNSGSTL
jgi:hypothetical protein